MSVERELYRTGETYACGMTFLDLTTFFGHLHPMVVHLPIGFLLLAVAFQVLSNIKRFNYLNSAVGITLLAGFVTAMVSCIFGYLLSLSGDYEIEILSRHKYSGIALAIFAGAVWFLSTSYIKASRVTINTLLTVCCLGLVLLLFYVGHQGGNLTHGAEYLSVETLTHVDRPKPSTVEEAYIFEDVIAPVLEKRCVGCHRAGKRRGELLLTSWENIMKGGKHGEVVVGGSLDKSELFRRITLDPADEDFMPTDGKTPLTKSETSVIKWWIVHGAVHDKIMSEIEGYDSIRQFASNVLVLPGSQTTDQEFTSDHLVNRLIPEKIDTTNITILRKHGFSIRLMAHHPMMLDVTLPGHSKTKIKDFEQQLSAVSKNIIWLNLSDNDFDEEDLVILKETTNLEKLRLEKNPVGDAIVEQVKDLKFLNAINLNETNLSSKGLSALRQNESLKNIYFWKTPAEKTK